MLILSRVKISLLATEKACINGKFGDIPLSIGISATYDSVRNTGVARLRKSKYRGDSWLEHPIHGRNLKCRVSPIYTSLATIPKSNLFQSVSSNIMVTPPAPFQLFRSSRLSPEIVSSTLPDRIIHPSQQPTTTTLSIPSSVLHNVHLLNLIITVNGCRLDFCSCSRKSNFRGLLPVLSVFGS